MSSLEEFADAIEDGDAPIVELFILNGFVDVNARLPRRFSPPALVHAAQFGQTEIVDILLRANARTDGADVNRRTACHAAADCCHPDVLALLLARQPNLAAVDANERTAFCIALRNCHFVVSERCALMLLDAGASLEWADPSHLCRFAATSTAAIQALIDRGVVVRELRMSDDSTPLHMAAWGCCDADVFEMLVKVCGIDLEARNCERDTCLHYAARSGNDFSLRWLLNAGADMNCVWRNGFTPLHDAYNLDCAVLLLAAGANVCARDNSGRTALHGVLLLSSMPIEKTAVHPLIAAGADLDVADDDGETARQVMADRSWTIDPDQVEAARREIAKTRLDFVRHRALQVCIGLQSLRIDALQTCEILRFSCLGGRIAPLIPFHIWWKIATTVKHYQTAQTK